MDDAGTHDPEQDDCHCRRRKPTSEPARDDSLQIMFGDDTLSTTAILRGANVVERRRDP